MRKTIVFFAELTKKATIGDKFPIAAFCIGAFHLILDRTRLALQPLKG